MRTILAVMLVVCFCFPLTADEQTISDAKKAAIAKALESFSGTWEIISAKPDGVTKQARQLVFRKDMTYAALDRDGKELWAGTFDLDPTATPKIWDHRSYDAKKNGGDALGIYELDGDMIRVCCVVGRWKDQKWTGKPRPTEFKLELASAQLEMRRVKTDKK